MTYTGDDFHPYAHKSFSLPSAAHRTIYGLGFTTAEVNAAKSMIIQAFTENVRYTLDGTTPTATVGFQRGSTDDEKEIVGNAAIMQAKFIAEQNTAVLQITLAK
jgi:hypothetical protein